MLDRHPGPWSRKLGSALSFVALAIAPGCVVEPKCYVDADCEGSLICTGDGSCVFECDTHADCDAEFGVEFVCNDHHCERSPSCTTCRFPNADHSCVHGDCALEACHDGFHDADGEPANGCEYHCELQNGGVEACNAVDDDCDAEIDEGFDLDSDSRNCGDCGLVCSAGPHARPLCESATCVYACESGWHDNDGDASTGCEAASCVPTTEVCNGHDDDCDCSGDSNGDGVVCGPGDDGVDEGFDKTLPTSCGPFCIPCEYAHGTGECVDGRCRLADCETSYLDLDGKAANGCEYACTPSGEEVCDFADNDCNGLIDEGGVCEPESCPADMVAVGTAYCMDRYEASRVDATATDQGESSSRALSQPGVLPWMVNPMTAAHLDQFEAACAAAGKRICTRDEWIAACVGADQLPYVYGAVFDREACNCVDTFCDDYCAEQGLTACDTASNCGYTHSSFHVMPTGSFPGCTNEYGTFDVNGNVWEVVPSGADARGYEVRGGAFNCAGASERVSCDFNAGWTALYAGFRCCKDLN